MNSNDKYSSQTSLCFMNQRQKKTNTVDKSLILSEDFAKTSPSSIDVSLKNRAVCQET